MDEGGSRRRVSLSLRELCEGNLEGVGGPLLGTLEGGTYNWDLRKMNGGRL